MRIKKIHPKISLKALDFANFHFKRRCQKHIERGAMTFFLRGMPIFFYIKSGLMREREKERVREPERERQRQRKREIQRKR